ncbi:cytidine deaminase-like protein [Amylocarpus encephaloides]|uniref:Cytidine deaminase-like protein n=1 Tax=Amylocarpus encephaloides TaxID=45428 RepID=A0A9P8C4R9_9HELO|nr:cytidine deaminase-like protein [Amylocarpus encephaloides]
MSTLSTGPEHDASPIIPIPGCLIPLKTTLETREEVKTLRVHVTAVRPQVASGTLGLIRTLLPKDGGFDLQHLRRFAKPETLPASVVEEYTSLSSSRAEGGERVIFLILAATSLIPSSALAESLEAHLESKVPLVEISVPLLAPTSAAQAVAWSNEYWPCVYKKSNPFGPHPSLVARAQEEVEGGSGRWMGVAWEAARQAADEGVGEGVGVCVVERKAGGEGRCVAVAGDLRWKGWGGRDQGGSGNVTAHAAMRAIGMITNSLSQAIPSSTPTIFQTSQHLPLESSPLIFPPDPDGYLCHDLEIYSTHEPCVMCSMAIVHSRFGRVVFEQRMRATGGICADGEGGLGHGMWWRKELNWTMLGWEFVRDGDPETKRLIDVDEHLNA